ncbi:hypothetical protein F152LOC_00980 [Pectobacterium brasiliense]|nr:hypothetical protein F152LOC_00980 [Pectobacterium brasiliense]
MIRVPLSTPMLLALTVAFSFFFCWYIDNQSLLLAMLSVGCFTMCIAELVQRLVEHYRSKNADRNRERDQMRG